MRHSDPRSTACVYTDPALLKAHGAIDALPSLPLDGEADRAQARATGTDSAPASLGPSQWKREPSGTTDDRTAMRGAEQAVTIPLAVNPWPVNANGLLTSHVNGPIGVHPVGLEPTTLSSED